MKTRRSSQNLLPLGSFHTAILRIVNRESDSRFAESPNRPLPLLFPFGRGWNPDSVGENRFLNGIGIQKESAILNPSVKGPLKSVPQAQAFCAYT